jgi:uncharacterized protein
LAQKEPSFLADAMLGHIARKLRIFGFDTLYIANAQDDDILKVGIDQGRVILTADRELFKRIVKAGASGVLVGGTDRVEDLAHIFSKNGIMSISLGGMNSRCSMCNGLLQVRTPDEVRNGIPQKVADYHNEFYQCRTCGKIYWEGGHLRRIRVLAKSVKDKLSRAAAT